MAYSARTQTGAAVDSYCNSVWLSGWPGMGGIPHSDGLMAYEEISQNLTVDAKGVSLCHVKLVIYCQAVKPYRDFEGHKNCLGPVYIGLLA